MGKFKPYILLGVAVLIALIATFLIMNYLQRTAKPKEVTLLEKKSIVVAVNDILAGAVLTKEMMKQTDYLTSSLPMGSFSDPSSLMGRVVIYPIRATEPIFESRLAPTTVKTGGVAALITPKKRAVSVKVDKVIGVAGFIYAGNRVDVLVSIEPKGGGQASQPITKIVLENIPVLATGPEFQKKQGKEEKATPVDVITLEVTPEEAEKLALAVTEGKILLALRNITDSEDVMTKGMTIPALLSSYSGSGPAMETKRVPVKRGGVKKPTRAIARKIETDKPVDKPVLGKKPAVIVELIKGNKVTELKFERSE